MLFNGKVFERVRDAVVVIGVVIAVLQLFQVERQLSQVKQQLSQSKQQQVLSATSLALVPYLEVRSGVLTAGSKNRILGGKAKDDYILVTAVLCDLIKRDLLTGALSKLVLLDAETIRKANPDLGLLPGCPSSNSR